MFFSVFLWREVNSASYFSTVLTSNLKVFDLIYIFQERICDCLYLTWRLFASIPDKICSDKSGYCYCIPSTLYIGLSFFLFRHIKQSSYDKLNSIIWVVSGKHFVLFYLFWMTVLDRQKKQYLDRSVQVSLLLLISGTQSASCFSLYLKIHF